VTVKDATSVNQIQAFRLGQLVAMVFYEVAEDAARDGGWIVGGHRRFLRGSKRAGIRWWRCAVM